MGGLGPEQLQGVFGGVLQGGYQAGGGGEEAFSRAVGAGLEAVA